MNKSKTLKQTSPKWWNNESNSAWDNIKSALKRDWEQTKHDFGSDAEPDTDQDVDDTIAQAVGKQPIPPSGVPTYEEHEDDFRYGYGARRQYGSEYDDWDDAVEQRLQEEWAALHPEDRESWKRHRNAIKYGWNYEG